MPDTNEQTRCAFCKSVVSEAARSECKRAGIIIAMCSKCLCEYFRLKQFDKDLSSLLAVKASQGMKVGR